MIMKLFPLLLALPMGLVSFPAEARHGYSYGQPGYSQQCFKNVYREQYIPGTQQRPGRVRRWTERQEVPCNVHREPVYYPQEPQTYPAPAPRRHVDNNSCLEGTFIGGILGGAGGYAASQGDGRGWAIPLGVVGGALVGCQLDGG